MGSIVDIGEPTKPMLTQKRGFGPVGVDIIFGMPDRKWAASISEPISRRRRLPVSQRSDFEKGRSWGMEEPLTHGDKTTATVPIKAQSKAGRDYKLQIEHNR